MVSNKGQNQKQNKKAKFWEGFKKKLIDLSNQGVFYFVVQLILDHESQLDKVEKQVAGF